MSQDLMSKLSPIIPFLIPALLLQLVLFIVALMKWVKKKKLPNRIVWFVILFANIIGPIAFLIYSSGKGDDEE